LTESLAGSVLARRPPFLGPGHIRKLDDDDALGLPIAFQHLGRTTADDVFAPESTDRRSGELLAVFIGSVSWTSTFTIT